MKKSVISFSQLSNDELDREIVAADERANQILDYEVRVQDIALELSDLERNIQALQNERLDLIGRIKFLKGESK